MKSEPLCYVRVAGWADGRPCSYAEHYVVSWNPHTRVYETDIQTTPDIEHATRFTMRDAFETWRGISRVQKRRPDGKPNRPLTALSVEFIRIPPLP